MVRSSTISMFNLLNRLFLHLYECVCVAVMYSCRVIKPLTPSQPAVAEAFDRAGQHPPQNIIIVSTAETDDNYQ